MCRTHALGRLGRHALRLRLQPDARPAARPRGAAHAARLRSGRTASPRAASSRATTASAAPPAPAPAAAAPSFRSAESIVCGRFNQTASGEEVAEAFGLDEAPELAPALQHRADAADRRGRRSSRRPAAATLALLTWGLVPRWRPRQERALSSTPAPRRPAEQAVVPRRLRAPPLPDPGRRLLRVEEHGARRKAALPRSGSRRRPAVRLRRAVGAGRPGDPGAGRPARS